MQTLQVDSCLRMHILMNHVIFANCIPASVQAHTPGVQHTCIFMPSIALAPNVKLLSLQVHAPNIHPAAAFMASSVVSVAGPQSNGVALGMERSSSPAMRAAALSQLNSRKISAQIAAGSHPAVLTVLAQANANSAGEKPGPEVRRAEKARPEVQ